MHRHGGDDGSLEDRVALGQPADCTVLVSSSCIWNCIYSIFDPGHRALPTRRSIIAMVKLLRVAIFLNQMQVFYFSRPLSFILWSLRGISFVLLMSNMTRPSGTYTFCQDRQNDNNKVNKSSKATIHVL